MTERNCFNCMYSDEWDSSGLGECRRMRYIAFVNDIGVCSRHRYDEKDEGMSALEMSELDCISSL